MEEILQNYSSALEQKLFPQSSEDHECLLKIK